MKIIPVINNKNIKTILILMKNLMKFDYSKNIFTFNYILNFIKSLHVILELNFNITLC